MGYPMNIGEAANAAGVTAKMIRHYESLGLIPAAARTDAGYRQYTAREVGTLRFIRQARTIGFSMKQIAQLLSLWAVTDRESREVKALASEHMAELDRRMHEMAQMRSALEKLARGCHGDHRPHCPILEELSGHAEPAGFQAPASAPGKRQTVERRRAGPARHDDHTGLVAWMQGLNRTEGTEHA
jgi:MerR family copper efflux transcriptional regulator